MYSSSQRIFLLKVWSPPRPSKYFFLQSLVTSSALTASTFGTATERGRGRSGFLFTLSSTLIKIMLVTTMMMPMTLMTMSMMRIMWASFQASLSPFLPYPLPAEFDQMFGGVHGFVVVVDLQCCQCFVSTPVSTLKLKLIQGNQKSETHLNWSYWKARR